MIVASLPQHLLDRILKDEEMIEKGREETKKSIVRETDIRRNVEPIHRPFIVNTAGWKQNNAEPQ